jgi:hypothetical protein
MNLTQDQINQLIKDQIGTNPLAVLPSNPDIAAAVANYSTSATALAIHLNNNLIAIYMTAFQNWSALVMAGKIPNTTPPAPPDAYAAVVASDSWTYVVKGTDPVCAMPAVPAVPQPPAGMVIAVGSHLGSNFWAALPANAGVPSGFTTPSPITAQDGTTGIFTWIAYPFGGWWEKVG